MDMLPLNFRIFQFFGLWYKRSNDLNFINVIHRSFVLFLIFQFSFFQCIALISVDDNNINEFSERVFVTLTFVAGCIKLIYFILQRQNICELIKLFHSIICQPRTSQERSIIVKYKYIAKKVFLFRLILTLSGALSVYIAPLLRSKSYEDNLPYKSYYIYRITNLKTFIITYTFQVIITLSHIIIDVALDSTSCGFLIFTCCQLELCCHRIKSGNDCIQKFTFKDYVIHHIIIHIINRKLQSTFKKIILPVFCFSLVTLCTSIHQLSQHYYTVFEHFAHFLYLLSLLCQVFHYCWFGNELQLQSKSIANTIYTIDWTVLKPCRRKNYWFIMLKSQQELGFFFYGKCVLTLSTFIWILKTSYAAFNLLKQVSNKVNN